MATAETQPLFSYELSAEEPYVLGSARTILVRAFSSNRIDLSFDYPPTENEPSARKEVSLSMNELAVCGHIAKQIQQEIERAKLRISDAPASDLPATGDMAGLATGSPSAGEV